MAILRHIPFSVPFLQRVKVCVLTNIHCGCSEHESCMTGLSSETSRINHETFDMYDEGAVRIDGAEEGRKG